jgi:hypothetical protein
MWQKDSDSNVNQEDRLERMKSDSYLDNGAMAKAGRLVRQKNVLLLPEDLFSNWFHQYRTM